MALIVNLIIYNIIFTYLFTVSIIFFHPITRSISVGIILISLALSFISAFFLPLSIFISGQREREIPKVWAGVTFVLFVIWFFICLHRPTIDTDANVYHLPLSLLMNNSVWYPGIGKLSTVFSYPNGSSVLATVFTSFKMVGFENIPNLIIWIMLGMGIFIYLASKKVSLFIAFLVTILLVFTPVLFWQSYNMGTDLPTACFILFGFLALSDKKFEDSILFFSLSAVFKTLGLVALLFMLPYILFLKFRKKEKINLMQPKIILATFIFMLYLARMIIATGNPLYPAVCLKIAPWGISEDVQKRMIMNIKTYSGVHMNFQGFFLFLKDFLFFPHRIKGEFWFWPFTAGCLIVFSYLFLKGRVNRRIDLNSGFIIFLICCLFGIWFIGSPLFRFIAGAFMFITLKLFIVCSRKYLPKLCRNLLYSSLVLTLSLFLFNAIVHIKQDALPLAHILRDASRDLRGGEKTVLQVQTQDGFLYYRATMRYCGRSPVPCLSAYADGEEEQLIQEFRKCNKKFLTPG